MSTPTLQPTLTPVRHCRVCGSQRVLDTGYRKRYYLMNMDQVVSLTYAACQDCQFIFQGEYVGDEFLNGYYATSPMLRRPEPTLYEIDQNVRQSGFLARHVDIKGKRVLEIGAHAGAFLRHVREHFGCETYFDELSDEARKVLAFHGLIDYRKDAPGRKMDVVVLRHVLEHIFDLDGFLTYLDEITAADGHLFIEVPDWSHVDRNTDPLIFEHLNHFNAHNLVDFMRRKGWQCEALEKSIFADDPASPNRVLRLIFSRSKTPALGDSSIVTRFRNFLDENYDKANRSIDALVAKLDPTRKVALYPASHLTFSALLETKLRETNIVGIFDIDAKKHGKIVDGIVVRPATDLKAVQPDLILVFTLAYEREIRESFTAMGLTAEVLSITQILEQ